MARLIPKFTPLTPEEQAAEDAALDAALDEMGRRLAEAAEERKRHPVWIARAAREAANPGVLLPLTDEERELIAAPLDDIKVCGEDDLENGRYAPPAPGGATTWGIWPEIQPPAFITKRELFEDCLASGNGVVLRREDIRPGGLLTPQSFLALFHAARGLSLEETVENDRAAAQRILDALAAPEAPILTDIAAVHLRPLYEATQEDVPRTLVPPPGMQGEQFRMAVRSSVLAPKKDEALVDGDGTRYPCWAQADRYTHFQDDHYRYEAEDGRAICSVFEVAADGWTPAPDAEFRQTFQKEDESEQAFQARLPDILGAGRDFPPLRVGQDERSRLLLGGIVRIARGDYEPINWAPPFMADWESIDPSALSQHQRLDLLTAAKEWIAVHPQAKARENDSEAAGDTRQPGPAGRSRPDPTSRGE
ncbi:hypothetical protein WV31_10635 [Magnetospirillum sp. ME-1]|uniref:hypothetical protein n=1 Tax=Magnetospirillum sp. ME-1 TaxID=1639348 RepID=UPI000A17F70A|nr:hypothetical protein [Magnetospirillum sp. ME-1]ARJ66083.1 hypothetical protein WV31_10635 [Magnetospirillum sp. ME-1]